MRKNIIMVIAMLFVITAYSQFPRNKVLIEEGTGTW